MKARIPFFDSWGRSFASTGLSILLFAPLVQGQHTSVEHEIAQLLASARPLADAPGSGRAPKAAVAAAEPSRVGVRRDGFLCYLGAPPRHHFPLSAAKPSPPDAIADRFLRENGRVFGLHSPGVGFERIKLKQGRARSYVRLQQTCAGIPIFAAEVTVQVSAQEGVEAVLSDVEPDLEAIENGAVSLAPTRTAAEATDSLAQRAAARRPGAGVATSEPKLTLFAPSVVGEAGPIRLVWQTDVASDEALELNERVLLDAHSGELVRAYPRYAQALDRRVYLTDTNHLARKEKDPDTGIRNVDNAYLHLGDTYNFYWNVHGRDSINDGGMIIKCVVDVAGGSRWTGKHIELGLPSRPDDIVAHEYTHGVTQYESDLIYADESGAINESFSMIWGEFVDLTNGHGNDDPTNRWYTCDECEYERGFNMANPAADGLPDRLGSGNYIPGGDVHHNCGVNLKLCYLLTDGDDFNGQTVTGMGLTNVAKLYYEANANILTSASGWTELYDALRQAAVNLGWGPAQRENLQRACQAVEIATNQLVWLYVDGKCSSITPNGKQECSIFGGPYRTVAQGLKRNPHGLFVRAGSYNEQMRIQQAVWIEAYDGTVTIGR